MRGRGERLALLFSIFVAACYWQKYPSLVETHTDLLVSMARKSADLVRQKGEYRPEDLAEFRYPYDRARDFARIVRERHGARTSFRRFEELLDRYGGLLATVDRLNADPDLDPEGEEVAVLARHVAEVEEQGRAVMRALDAE